MRCLKTRTLLGLLTAAWLIGVLYFIKDFQKPELSTHDGESYVEDYEKFIDSIDDDHVKSTARIDGQRVGINYTILNVSSVSICMLKFITMTIQFKTIERLYKLS
jgi:hypothetical protein